MYSHAGTFIHSSKEIFQARFVLFQGSEDQRSSAFSSEFLVASTVSKVQSKHPGACVQFSWILSSSEKAMNMWFTVSTIITLSDLNYFLRDPFIETFLWNHTQDIAYYLPHSTKTLEYWRIDKYPLGHFITKTRDEIIWQRNVYHVAIDMWDKKTCL